MDFAVIEAILLSTKGFTGTLDGYRIELPTAQAASERLEFLITMDNTGMTDDALLEVEREYEWQGFLNGFRLGVRFMLECGASSARDIASIAEGGRGL